MGHVTHAAAPTTVPTVPRTPARAARVASSVGNQATLRRQFDRAPVGNQAMLRVQRKAIVDTPGDTFEREADAIADRVVRMPSSSSSPPAIQRACATCDEERVHRAPTKSTPAPHGAAVQAAVRTTERSGAPLPGDVRAYFESRIGHDLGAVRIHHDGEAAMSARAVNARAYTVGCDVVFGAGEYQPGTDAGKHLLAHELAHVVQQRAVGPRVMRQQTTLDRLLEGIHQLPPPDVATFCTPYATVEQARQVRAIAVDRFIPALRERFGPDVGDIWTAYLNRRHGASLARRMYTGNHAVARAFAASATIAARQEELANAAEAWFARTCPSVGVLYPVPAEQVFSAEDLAFPINFNVPTEVPGHIAGGISDSDAGPDSRRVTGEVIFVRYADQAGHTIRIQMRLALRFIVDDAVDFCPGGAGTGMEQLLTVPLSRLEASGAVWPAETLGYDVPFHVEFAGPMLDRDLNPATVRRCDPNAAVSPPRSPGPNPAPNPPQPPANPDLRFWERP
jgi:hypothetical protein